MGDFLKTYIQYIRKPKHLILNKKLLGFKIFMISTQTTRNLEKKAEGCLLTLAW